MVHHTRYCGAISYVAKWRLVISMMREHGGDLDRAIAHFGGDRQTWLDLSTGINPHAYPIGDIANHLWCDLPDQALFDEVHLAAQTAYQTSIRCVSLSGAQQAIQIYPSIIPAGAKKAAILHPTYNEHEAQLRRQGWDILLCKSLNDMRGADCAVIVNPNNPDGQSFAPQDLLTLAKHVSTLIIDESFCDPYSDLSVLPLLDGQKDNIIILRSFGKFYGLAGMRLGFVFGADSYLDAFSNAAGKWSVSGPALSLGASALRDHNWRFSMTAKLAQDALRLDDVMIKAGLHLVGGTSLFRLYKTDNAQALQIQLAKHHIWTRIFSYDKSWIRIGLPQHKGWDKLTAALEI